MDPTASEPNSAGLDARLRRTGQRLDGSEQSRVAFLVGKIRRHVHWARRDGLRRLIEEDELDPRERIRKLRARRNWRKANPDAGAHTRAVFVVGLQRSGTNMVTRGLDESPEFQVFNENHRKAFARYRIKPDPVISSLITASAHSYALFKPLCDSQRTPELLAAHSTPNAPATAIWVFRDPRGRAQSAVAKFGDSDKTALEAINAGLGGDLWQSQGLSSEVLQTLSSFDVAALSDLSAAGLFWWVRNSLYYSLGLDRREDVILVHYDDFVREPRPIMAAICRRLGLPLSESLYQHADTRAANPPAAVDLDPRVWQLCDELYQRLTIDSRLGIHST